MDGFKFSNYVARLGGVRPNVDSTFLIGFSTQTLRNWSKLGIGPRCLIVKSGHGLYRIVSVRNWIQ